MTLLDVLKDAILIFIIPAVIFFISSVFINVITRYKTDIKYIDELLCKIRKVNIDNILLLLTMVCIYISVLLFMLIVITKIME